FTSFPQVIFNSEMFFNRPGEYLSIDDVLATEQRVQCKFHQTVHGLGFLDNNLGTPDIPAGHSMPLPFWLAKSLSLQRRKILTADFPNVYKESY
ncbi:unnamed protein product, partial [Cyprideis torosa]